MTFIKKYIPGNEFKTVAHSASSTKEIIHQRITPIDEKKKMASEILKRVDLLIKNKELQKALLETCHAKEIDPQNVYASALEERIQNLLVEKGKNLEKEHQNEKMKETSTIPIVSSKTTVPDIQKNLNQQSTIQRVQSAVPTPNRQNNVTYTSTRETKSDPVQQIAFPSAQTSTKNDTFTKKPLPKIVMIDDDVNLLSAMHMMIESRGFEVISLSTSDEAYTLLKRFTPDIILCDINLETSTMGGLTFFEKVQEIDRLKNIPFIFLTGLSDEAIIRTGKEMGVDDYLTKPISEKNLISTLRGRLKRFDQLRNLRSQFIPAANFAPVAFDVRG
jgi:PleD family two-component response regulator